MSGRWEPSCHRRTNTTNLITNFRIFFEKHPPPHRAKNPQKNLNLWNLYMSYSWLFKSSWNLQWPISPIRPKQWMFVITAKLNCLWSNFPDHVWRFWVQTRSSRHVQGLMLGLVFVLFVYYRSSVVSETWRWLRIRKKKSISAGEICSRPAALLDENVYI